MALSKTNKKNVKTMSVAEQIEMLNKEVVKLKKENAKTAKVVFVIQQEIERRIRVDRAQMKEMDKYFCDFEPSMVQTVEDFFAEGIEAELKKTGVKDIGFCIKNQNIHLVGKINTNIDCWFRGTRDGKGCIFLCECKTFLKKEHIIAFEENADKLMEVLKGFTQPGVGYELIFGYNKIDKEAKEYAKAKNYLLYIISGNGNIKRE